MHFGYAVEFVLSHEGGYVNDPVDPGGETKYGISKRSYPDVDIANLTKAGAADIYRRDWWGKHGYGRIEDAEVACKVFDLAVNVGPKPAHKMLQRAVRAAHRGPVAEDGIIGPQTLEAVNNAYSPMVVGALRAEAAAHYRTLIERNPALAKFERGWMNRAYS